MNATGRDRNKKKKQCAVIIEWVDAAMWGCDSRSRESAENCGLTHGYACGWLIKEDDEKVILALDWFDEHDLFRHVCSYPKSGIKKMRQLGGKS